MGLDDARLRALVTRLSVAEKVLLTSGRDSWSTHDAPAVGLGPVHFSDGPAGVRGTTWDEREPSVCLPSPTALGASWDPVVAHDYGHALGSEARRKGVHVVLGPTINIQRTPYGGRHFEALSEDPELTSLLATHYVLGVQQHAVAASVKHYVANDSETERYTVDVVVDERTLREVYLRAFEGPVVEGGAWVVMSAYNSVNGETATESRLLTSPLQDEWDFRGLVVSDWTAVRSVASARHPQDLAMPGPDTAWGDHLLEAVRAGDVPEADVDRKVHRLLRLAARVGALEGAEPERSTAPLSLEQTVAAARDAAVEGMVLLRNDGLLPATPPRRVAVVGEAARHPVVQGGGSVTVVPTRVVGVEEGLRQRWPDAEVTWAHGAVVRQGQAPLEPGTFESDDATPGLTVRYLDAAGVELGRERRESSWLVWFGGASHLASAATVELAFTWRHGAEPGAPARLGLAGLADVEVLADGRSVAAETISSPPGADFSTVVLNPPGVDVEVPTERATVDVVVRFRPAGGGVPDALALRVGTPPPLVSAEDLRAEAVEHAAAADLVVLVVSASPDSESEGYDRTSLALPGDQDALVRAVVAANPRTVVAVDAGAPVLLPWCEEVAAVLACWFPGQEFGRALADVVSGAREPGGRLPVTWPAREEDVPVHEVVPRDGRLRYDEGLDVGYRAWSRSGHAPAYVFGHGLGYTTWRLSDLTVTPTPRGDVSLSVLVTNSGPRAGKGVVQVYLGRDDGAVARPRRWLAGSAVVRREAGGAERVDLVLPRRRFAHWASGTWQVEPGCFDVEVGLSCDDPLRLTAAVDLADDPRPGDRPAPEGATRGLS